MLTNSGKNEMLLTSTVTRGGYITTKRTTAVATLSNSDTTELLQQKNNGSIINIDRCACACS